MMSKIKIKKIPYYLKDCLLERTEIPQIKCSSQVLVSQNDE